MGDFNIREEIFRDFRLRDEVFDHIRFPALYIDGIEVTQAIQYYHAAQHLTDAADRGPDNSVRLIAGKPAYVRVYVRAGFFHSDIPNVTGTLEVSRRHHGFLFGPGTMVSPLAPGTVTARRNPDYATERGTLGFTLNFVLPASEMCGTLRLTARIQSPGGDADTHTITVGVHLQQTLRLRGIFVGYNGPTSTAVGAPNVTIAAPTLADLQTTAAWTLLTFPVRSAATFGNAGTITWTQPLTDAPSCPGCCTPNWVALNAAVQAQRVADGNRTDVLYYGLMGVGIPMGPVIGCNSGGVSTGSNGDGVTMAHELGHACGLPHAPCGTPGDPTYPAYEPYDPASTPQAHTGEYGLDISNGNIFSPATFRDMMSYCGPRWISLHNYGRLTNNTNLAPVSVCMDYPWWRDIILYDRILIPELWLPDPPPFEPWRNPVINPVQLISIIGVMHSEVDVEIKSVVRLEAVPEVSNGVKTGLTAELVGGRERVISSAPVFRLRTHGSGCGCHEDEEEASYPFLFQAFVPSMDEGDGLRIRMGEKEIWRREAEGGKGDLARFKARVKEDILIADWLYKAESREEPEFWLQWSDDEGKTWHGLAAGLRGERAEVSAAGLPAGNVAVRLLASDGFWTTLSEMVYVDVARRAPVVSILHPREGQTFTAGQTLRVFGMVSRSTGEEVDVKEARWMLDRRELKAGLDDFVLAPPAGEHELTLIVAADGDRVEASVRIRTVSIPDENEMEEYPKGAA